MDIITDNRVLPLCRYEPVLMKVGQPTPYKAQDKAVDAALTHGRGIISMPTGTGKSMVIAMIAARLNVRTLVIVPTVEIKRQLRESLKSTLIDPSFVRVENIDSNSLNTLTDFDCLIIDEAHHVAAKTYHKLNKTAWKNICYRFFLTATPFRNRLNEQILFEAIAGNLIYQLTYKQAIKEGYIVPVEAYYIDLPKKQVEGYTWNQVYNELVVNNEERNHIIARVMHGLHLTEKSHLCLVKEIQHGVNIARWSSSRFSSGQDDKSREYITFFNQGYVKSLIGTTGILGEGVDTKPAEYVIIAGLGKAKSAFMQQVGRAVRKYGSKESAKIIIFKDRSHKWTLSHFNAQKKILLEEYGVKVLKLDLE